MSINGVPGDTIIDHRFMQSFCTRAALYHAKNPNSLVLSKEIQQIILSVHNVTNSEMSVLNDKKLRLSYQTMYEQILHNDSHNGKVVSYLEKMKLDMASFDFKIYYNKDDLPDAIVFTTHGMRRNLIRFGDVLFLDSQQRYLKNGWPYIGPIIMTNKNKVGLTCEAVVLSESNEKYAWILKAQAVMEPRRNPSNIRLIFAYGLITHNF